MKKHSPILFLLIFALLFLVITLARTNAQGIDTVQPITKKDAKKTISKLRLLNKAFNNRMIYMEINGHPKLFTIVGDLFIIKKDSYYYVECVKKDKSTGKLYKTIFDPCATYIDFGEYYTLFALKYGINGVDYKHIKDSIIVKQ